MLLPLPFLLAEVLVVLRVHGGPAAYLVTDQPEVRRDAIDVADLPGVARVALGEGTLCSQNRGECPAKVPIEEVRLSLNTGLKIVEEWLIGNS